MKWIPVALLITVAIHFPVHAQPNAPPNNFTNSIGMKFVWIPPGSFIMGSPKEEEGRSDNETQHKVTLTKGFYMGVYTVTQEQWMVVMGNNPSFFKSNKNLPVESVSWDDCQDFLLKLSQKEGQSYRLPTEAEWEYACRAGTTTRFHFGATIATDQANFNGNLDRVGIARNTTTPVGSFPSNKWGLHDMHGNTWQWCLDWHDEYPKGAVVDPNNTVSKQLPRASEFILQLSSTKYSERHSATDALKNIGVPALPLLRKAVGEAPDLESRRRAEQLVAGFARFTEVRVLRGGAFNYQASYMRSAYRFRLVANFRTYNVGFRVVKTLADD